MDYKKSLQKGTTSQSNIAMTEPNNQISQEMLQALAQHLSQIQPQKPSPLQYGPYKLTPLPSQKAFKTKEPVDQYEQCLIDYAWNAKNRAQLTMSLQAFAWYFNSQQKQVHQRVLQIKADEEVKLEPQTPNKKLEGEIYDLKISNLMLEDKLRGHEEMLRNFEELKAYVASREHYEQNMLWKQFPYRMDAGKMAIMEKIYSQKISQQVCLQQAFRLLSSSHLPLIKGMTFKSSTYKGQNGFRGCSYVTTSINLAEWDTYSFEGLNFSLGNLLENGLVHKLIITKQAQVSHIPDERLFTTIMEIMEAEKGKTISVELHPIPPSYYAEALDEARAIVLITARRMCLQHYDPIKTEELVSEDAVDIIDQINYYRSIVLKQKLNMLHYNLIAADHKYQIYAEEDFGIPFPNQKSKFPGEVLHFQKVHVTSQLIQGGDYGPDITTPYISSGTGSLGDNIDDIGMANLENAMSA